MKTNFKDSYQEDIDLLDDEFEDELAFEQEFSDNFNDEDHLEKNKFKYPPSQELALNEFSKAFHKNSKDLAVKYMKLFFFDKEYFKGGKVPLDLLITDKNISKVLNYDIIEGVDNSYRVLEKIMNINPKVSLDGEVTEDIKIVNQILQLLSYSKVPQQFAGGMLCLYLEYVNGVKFEDQ